MPEQLRIAVSNTQPDQPERTTAQRMLRVDGNTGTVHERRPESNYLLPIVMVQSDHLFSDNDSTFEGFVICIDEWNTTDKTPHTKLTPCVSGGLPSGCSTPATTCRSAAAHDRRRYHDRTFTAPGSDYLASASVGHCIRGDNTMSPRMR